MLMSIFINNPVIAVENLHNQYVSYPNLSCSFQIKIIAYHLLHIFTASNLRIQ